MSGDPVLPNASSYIQLYSSDSPRATQQFQIDVKAASVTFVDSQSARPWKFKASAYKFQDAAGLNEIDLRVKMGADDAERAANAASASANATAVSAADVRAQAAENVNALAIAAEIARASGVEAANAAAVVAEATARDDAVVAEAAARAASDSTHTAAIAAEEARATAAEDNLTVAISNLIGAAPAAMQSLSALITAYGNMDDDQEDILDSLLVDVAAMRADLDLLLNQGGT